MNEKRLNGHFKDIRKMSKPKFYKLPKIDNINMFPVICNGSLDELFSFYLRRIYE